MKPPIQENDVFISKPQSCKHHPKWIAQVVSIQGDYAKMKRWIAGRPNPYFYYFRLPIWFFDSPLCWWKRP